MLDHETARKVPALEKTKKMILRKIANLFRGAICVIPIKNGGAERDLLSVGQSCVFTNGIKYVNEISDEILY